MSNICDRCDGQKTVYYEVQMQTGKIALAQHQSSTMKLCMCPIEREPHDGILHGRNTYKVKHMFGLRWPKVASVHIGHDDVSHDEVWLSPQQALSLLAWLKQEEAMLEQLVKEAS